jgi:ankyrin repeat protein
MSLVPDVDVNAAQADGATALHWAAYVDDEMLAERLLASGADAGAVNDLGVTPVSLACENGSPVMVNLLVEAGADPNAATGTGETALMSCARTGSIDAVRALLAAGADVEAREQTENQTALMWAVAQRHAGVVRLLIDHGADVAARSRERRKVISRRLQSELKYGELGRNYGTDAEETRVGGFTPLLFAARHGDVELARLLLEAGADVDDRAPDGASALVVAVHSDHRKLALFLLEQGANPDAASAGYTALHAAVLTGDLVVIKALLSHDARPDAQVTLATKVTRNGQVLMIGEHLLGATPFALAAKFTEVEIMRVLASAGADARLPLKNGWTPLMLAAGASWRYAVWDRRDRALAKAPAFQAQMYDEATTLAAVTLVADLGADLNAVDADGSTALHHVVDKGFDAVVGRLIDRGADLAAVNSRAQTPLSIVERGGNGNVAAASATADLLRSLGAW